MLGIAVLLSLFGTSFRLDEKVILTLATLAVAGLLHAFGYTAAEGAHPSKRWAFQRSADGLVIVAVYVIVRVWL